MRNEGSNLSRSSIVANELINEREALTIQVGNLNMEVEELKEKYEKSKVELKNSQTELEKLKTEMFVQSKKMQTMASEHKSELKCYHDEIEDLNIKLKAAEKRLLEETHAGDHHDESFQDGCGLDDILENDKLSTGSGDLKTAPMAHPTSIQGLLARDRRNSLAIRLGAQGLTEQAANVLADVRYKELTDKIQELNTQIAEHKTNLKKLQEEVESAHAKLKEESKKLDINNRKMEARDQELEDLRQRILDENNRNSNTVNEFNEEIDQRDRKIAELRRQLRAANIRIESRPSIAPAKV